LPPLPSNTPLLTVRVETRPAFRAAKRTLPRLPQTTRRGGSPYAAPSCLQAFAAGDPPLLPCARRLIARAPSTSVLFGHGHPGASRQRLASASLTKPVWPPRYSSGADHRPEPVIAVALSDDPQQHGRFGHGGQTGLVRDGRIGYWYTNSRFARGASRLRGGARVPGLSFFRRNEAMRERRRVGTRREALERTLWSSQPSAAVKCSGISAVRRLRQSANGRIRR